MVWKIGCLMAAVGVVATVGSCALFGTAIHRATERRQVEERSLRPGAVTHLADVEVDPDGYVEVRVEATVSLPDALVERERETGEIIRAEVPLRFVARRLDGTELGRGTARAAGTQIVPASDHPSHTTFDRNVSCSFTSERMGPVRSGRFEIELEVPEISEEGRPVAAARVVVFDRVAGTASRWALSGLLSLLVGPAVVVVGLVVFVIGLLMRSSSRRQQIHAG